jgi:hypothetical protein
MGREAAHVEIAAKITTSLSVGCARQHSYCLNARGGSGFFLEAPRLGRTSGGDQWLLG